MTVAMMPMMALSLMTTPSTVRGEAEGAHRGVFAPPFLDGDARR